VKSFAFFLDASLDEGHSYPSATFNNLELHATGKEEAAASFDLDVVEIWCPNHVLQRVAEEEEAARRRKTNVLQNEKFKADQMLLAAAGKYQAHHENA